MIITFYFLRGLKKVLQHTYVVAGRRLLKNTVENLFLKVKEWKINTALQPDLLCFFQKTSNARLNLSSPAKTAYRLTLCSQNCPENRVYFTNQISYNLYSQKIFF